MCLDERAERLMRIFTSWNQIPSEPHVLTIGNFDGVHRGHQALLQTVQSRAKALGASSLAITFDPLPMEVLAPERAPLRLTLAEHRLRLLAACGIEQTLLMHFDLDFAALTPEEFVRLVVTHAQPYEIVIGEDFHFGRGRTGNPTVLRELGERFGFAVTVLSRLGDEESYFSSSRIRQAIAQGAVKQAAVQLGRPHFVVGTVVPGEGRGAKLGYPTANLRVLDRLLPPADGIYASIAFATNTWYPALTYLGTRPTFPGAGHAVEVYLLTPPARPLQGETISIFFLERLRPDQAFRTGEELIAQMVQDEQRGRALLAPAMISWPPPLVAALVTPLEGAQLTHDDVRKS